MKALFRLLRHLWLDADDAHRVINASAMKRLEARVQDSERRHTGEVCLCVEASLPVSYLWRHLHGGQPMERVVRERALTLFSKLRVWDTELNNGVLIYLQLAERRIEIVADRGLARHVGDNDWQETLAGVASEFRANRYEDGLARAIDSVTSALQRYFPAAASTSEARQQRDNQLPDRPVIR